MSLEDPPHSNQLVTDLTAPCQLGGIFAPMLRGPTPAALVAQLAPTLYATSAIPNPATFDLPVNTRPSGAALQVNSWREWNIIAWRINKTEVISWFL